MKNYFEEPAIRVELFRVEDVVTLSINLSPDELPMRPIGVVDAITNNT